MRMIWALVAALAASTAASANDVPKFQPDARLNLLRCPDDVFLKFLCEIVHPIVRQEETEAQALVAEFNAALARSLDGANVRLRGRAQPRSPCSTLGVCARLRALSGSLRSRVDLARFA
jgi:AbiJ N-terminal domain 3